MTREKSEEVIVQGRDLVTGTATIDHQETDRHATETVIAGEKFFFLFGLYFQSKGLLLIFQLFSEIETETTDVTGTETVIAATETAIDRDFSSNSSSYVCDLFL